jgi:hypothetical protein
MLSAFGEGVTVKVTPSSTGDAVTAVVSNPASDYNTGTPWSEIAETAFVRFDAAEVTNIVPGESIITIRGKDYSVVAADLGEGAIWRCSCARADVSFSGRGRR